MDLVYDIGPTGFIAAIDLKDAWKQFHIFSSHQFMFGWHWKGKRVVETRFPFGWAEPVNNFVDIGSAFTHVVRKTMSQRLRDEFDSFPHMICYIDDITIGAQSLSSCRKMLSHVMEQCRKLGLVVNVKKTQEPTQFPRILGYIYNVKTS